MSSPHAQNRSDLPEGWSLPKPEKLPQPTYWPAITAFAVALMFFGIATSLIISAVGAVLFGLSVWKWIGDLLDE